MAGLEFDTATLPWVDRETFPEELERRLAAGELSAERAEELRRWREGGYLVLPGAVEHELIDRLLEEYERAWRERPPIKALVEGRGVVPLPEVPSREELGHHHYRLMDFQDISETARRVMLHPAIVERLTHFLGAPPVAMQNLFFEYGSEQRVHQDFPFVQADHLSHLAASWVALEDVDDDNGPLFYYPGSHRLPKYAFYGEALGYDGRDEAQVAAFEAHLEKVCAEAGSERLVLRMKKGDVLLWHAALAHGGSPVKNPSRTRLSFVSHYSTRAAYPRDRRAPQRRPEILHLNGGMLYRLRPPGPLARLRGRLAGLLGG